MMRLSVNWGNPLSLDFWLPNNVRETKKIDEQVEEWADDNKDSNDAAKALSDIYDAEDKAKDTIVAPFEKLGSYLTDGVKLLKQYWYVPVIIGGVIVGYKIVGRANMTKALAAIAAKSN